MRILRQKKCNCCGKTYDLIPEDARKGEESRNEIPGYYFECDCKSTLYVPDCLVLDFPKAA